MRWHCRSVIIALSFRCRRWRFGFVSGHVSLAWSIALCTQELFIRPRVLKERWREERTGRSFLVIHFNPVIRPSKPKTKKKKKKPKNNKSEIRGHCMRRLDLHGLGTEFIKSGTNKPQTVLNKKKEEENKCIQAVHSLITLGWD